MQNLIASLFSEIQKLRGDIKQEVRSAVGEVLAGGRQLQVQPTLRPPPVQQDDPMSETHDYDLMYATLNPVPPSSTPVQLPPAVQPVEVPPYRPSGPTTDYLYGLLLKHFPGDPNARFKSPAHMETVEMALARKENFVAVLPTGGGKSLIFTLPPFNEPHFTTYVIVPNKSLLQDQLEKIGLRVCVWGASRRDCDEDAQLVFLAMESATSQRFQL